MNAVLVLVLVGVASSSGLPKGWERIVGGEEASPHEFPWIVELRQGGDHYCGGSIISEDWVLTSAQCSSSAASSYELVAGDHNIGQTDGTEQRRQVSRIILHPSFGNADYLYENDIGLMKLATPLEFNAYVQPVAIPNSSFVSTERAVAAGWGSLTEGGNSPLVLNKVDVPVVTDTDCRAAYGQMAIADSMICAGEGGKDSCEGDAGGPLNCERDSVQYVCGIVSWGNGCGRPGYPGVYTEVSHFGQWVEETISGPPESNDTWVEQREGCGGVLSGSSGYISYKLDELYSAHERCVWTIKSGDRESIRVRVRSSGLDSGANISITEFDYEGAATSRTIPLGDLDSHVVRGPVVLLAFSSGSIATGTGFDFDFYGTGWEDSTGLVHEHIHNGAASGSQSFPPGGGAYSDGAFATLVVNPADTATAFVQFTRLDIEGPAPSCPYDWVQVFQFANGGFQAVSEKTCGNTPPTTTYYGREGILLLIFKTDSSITQTGFAYSYGSVE